METIELPMIPLELRLFKSHYVVWKLNERVEVRRAVANV